MEHNISHDTNDSITLNPDGTMPLLPQEYTPREIADFLFDEVLGPFQESSLYDDYQNAYIETNDGAEDFQDRLLDGMRLLGAAPEMQREIEEEIKRLDGWIKELLKSRHWNDDVVQGMVISRDKFERLLPRAKGELHAS